MKPFNLEEALNGAKVITRDGRLVTQLTKFKAEESETLYGVVNKEIVSWKDDGKFKNDHHILDLFMYVEPIRIWVNIFKKYNCDEIYIGSIRYKSKEDAIKSLDVNDPDYIKTIEINDIV